MRISSLLHLFLITILPILCISVIPIHNQCLEDQRTLLLHLKNSLEFNSSISTKLVQWNQSTDCCIWEGVTCNKVGHVTGLDLNSESISGGLDSSSSLFSLLFLQSLNLASNSFNFAQIPSGFKNLTSLTYLNLSYSDFSGQIPIEFSRMTRLVTLDLSNLCFLETLPLKLENPNLAMLVLNLTALKELYLDGVNISAQGYDWCQAISTSLPNLRVLSMSNCHLSGPIHSSLVKLRFLSVIRLDQNDLAAPVPNFFANFTNLTALHLSYCNLNGKFEAILFKIPTLRSLDLSYNKLLEGSFPEFPQNGSLHTLVLSYSNFSGAIPNSIGNLRLLSRIDLLENNFSGPIPNSMASLAQLDYVDLAYNMFTGPIPSFQMSKNLTHIDLHANNLLGPIPSTHFEGLLSLVHIDLRFNSFYGSIPSSLFALPSLQQILLSNNRFDGLVAQFSNASSSMLKTLDLSGNKLEGTIPSSFFDLKSLYILSLSFNNLNGTIPLETFHRLGNLTTLDLSYNSFSIETSGNKSSSTLFPQLTTLSLASCKVRKFPYLKDQSSLFHLDLSDNQIGGEIPNWIWKVNNRFFRYLNLSHNLLENLQEPYVIPSLSVLDLHSNRLQGELPIPPQTATYVDYSSNNFSSSIPVDIGNNLTFAYLFSVSNNNLTGTIPESICNAFNLQVLDMSKNSLSGMIPSCLTEMSETLGVLNLGKNNLTGNISGSFLRNCGLKTLDLHGNLLEGKVPQSLGNCRALEVLNLGNNRINDTFPGFLKKSSNLRVIILRSNMFHGGIQCRGGDNSWPNLQIIDIASNHFIGHLIPKCFLNWKAMMDDENGAESELNNLHFKFLKLNNFYYQDTVTVTNKGLEMELVKILTVFTSIDFSNNSFEGDIPATIGDLKALYVLNLSHNALAGSIPPSIGNLKQLGSLDLSVNNLSGAIPTTLAHLTFLSFLNVSYNRLSGRIPKGNQLQTFTETSFEGNERLCGFQLNITCGSAEIEPPTEDRHSHPENDEIKLEYVSAALGYAVGSGFFISLLYFYERWRKWYYKHVDRVVSWILNQQEQERIDRIRVAYRNPIRRL